MGVFRIDEAAEAEVDAIDPDVAIPVGVEGQARCITARRTVLDADGELRFSVEQSALLFPAVVRFLPSQRGVSRFEVKAKPISGIASKDELVVTEYPYSNGWWMQARFKPALRRSRDEREREVERVLAEGSPADIHASLDELEFDPFETGKWLTAALAAPPRSLAAHTRSPGKLALWVFGVCESVERFGQVLYEHEAMQRLLAKTRRGELFVGPPGHRRPFPQARAGEANAVMLLAIKQALAGPSNAKPVSVRQLAKNLYRNHLYNLLGPR
jgi:hypothetical protein